MEHVVTHSPEETRDWAAAFAKKLPDGTILALDGDLGAGKTVFVKGLAKGLGIYEPIVSPTFTIVREYEGSMPLAHFDVYRISDMDEMHEIGFEEYLFRGGIVVIEWATLIEPLLPPETLWVSIRRLDDTARSITIREKREEKA